MSNYVRFEVCRNDHEWWARFRAANGRVVWVTETYQRRASALKAITSLTGAEVYLSPYQDWPEIAWGPRGLMVEIRDIDERTEPYVPPPVVLQAPFYHSQTARYERQGRRVETTWETFWHDRTYHYENCSGDDCTEGTPPTGTEVRSHMGTATFKETARG